MRTGAEMIASRLKTCGYQAWIVGGAVRDLALNSRPTDIDMATDAHPEVIESLFAHTTLVGKAFGTIIVHVNVPDRAVPGAGGVDPNSEGQDIDVELTTFRSEGAYKDGRHPDEVTYGSSAEEDARRRDFTCNALYLDPSSDEFLDPEQGLADLEAGRLRCVGEPSARFAEDGLRLLRLARLTARLGLDPDEDTLAGARTSRGALEGVSAERVLAELRGIFAAPQPVQAFHLMRDLGILEGALPGISSLAPEGSDQGQRLAMRLGALAELKGPVEFVTGLALLLDPDPFGEGAGAAVDTVRGRAERLLVRLHPSRELRRGVLGSWDLAARVRAILGGEARRSERLLLIRDVLWHPTFLRLRAWACAGGLDWGDSLEALARERASLSQGELFPRPLLSSEDLAAAAIERGPRWGELLLEAEALQLDGVLQSPEQARRWLADLS